jgi:transcriptional regulator with XRE-family HTH domain
MSVDPARVREARSAAGLSLAQLAGDQVSRTFIHLIEQGRSRPSRKVLALIARRTGKPMGYFLITDSRNSQLGDELASELSEVAAHIRRFVSATRPSKLERGALNLVEASVRHGADIARSLNSKPPR